MPLFCKNCYLCLFLLLFPFLRSDTMFAAKLKAQASGASRAPPRRSALGSPFGELSPQATEGVSAAARASRLVCSEIEVSARRAQVSPPYAKGIDVAPDPNLCVGRDAHSAAVGGYAALRMRHTPCGCIDPPDAPSNAIRRAGCPQPAANSVQAIVSRRRGAH